METIPIVKRSKYAPKSKPGRPMTKKSVAARLGKQKQLVQQGFNKGLSIRGITEFARCSELKVREILTSKSPDIDAVLKLKSELASACSALADVRFTETADQLTGLAAAKASALYARQAQDLSNRSAQYGSNVNINILIQANNNVKRVEELLLTAGIDPTTIIDPASNGVILDPLPELPAINLGTE